MSSWLTFCVAFLQPPGLNILLFLIGLYCWVKSHEFLTKFWIFISILLLYAFSIPFVTHKLLASLEEQYPTFNKEELLNQKDPTAIVVLSSEELPNRLVRSQFVAQLAKDSKIPILVSGGNKHIENGDSTEATIMAKSLANDFNVTDTVWVENDSRTTIESAKFTKKILEVHAIKKIFLVTNAWHMPRALEMFKKQGIDVVPVPIKSNIELSKDVLKQFTPSAMGIMQSEWCIHEHLGIIWYKILDQINNHK